MTLRVAVSRGVAAVTLCALVIAVYLTFGDETTAAGDVPFIVMFATGILGMAAVGAVLTARAPDNVLGPLFQITAASIGWSIASQEYAQRAATDLAGLPGGALVLELGQLAIPIAAASLMAVFLLFPEGVVPTRRWRVVLWLLIASVVAGLVQTGLVATTQELDNGSTLANPFAVSALAGWTWVSTFWAATLAAGAVPSLLAVVIRFRRSSGEQRQQMRWLAWAAGLFLVSLVAVVVTGAFAGPDDKSTANDIAFTLLIASATLGLPLASAVAILRYRLYDLDLVVKKTAVFTIVALSLTVLYLVGLGLAAASGLGPIFGVILFVLTFNPVRRRARSLADRLVYGKRATPFEVLSEFSERVGETYSIDDVLPRMTQLLAASTGATEVRVWLRQERTFTPLAAWPRDAPVMDALPANGDGLPDLGAGASAYPVSHQGEMLGAMTLAMPANDPMDPTKERLVTGLASQAGLALQNVRLVQDLRASRRRIVAAQDERAKRLERNIHDGAQQQLVALTVQLKLARTVLDRDPEKAAELLDTLQGTATSALEDLRDLARGIYPPLLADKGLAAALEAQARKTTVPATVACEAIGRYSPEIEAAVYFCTLEALTNVAKYAGASRVEVRLAERDGELDFEVADDGAGFDTAAATLGTGRQGMADRLEAIGGSLTVTSAPGEGTVVRGRIPVVSVT